MKNILSLLLITLFVLSSAIGLNAQNKQIADKIVAVVNDKIILKSEVDQEVAQFLQGAELQNRNIEFTEDLWYSALQSIVDNYLLLEKARMDSIVVSDDLVNRQMDQRIRELIQQAGSEEALEEAFGQSLIQMRAEFRDQFREQMIVQRVQQQIFSSVNITRPEVIEFFNSIPDDELPVIPEQVSLSHIVITPPPLEDAENEAFQKAAALRDSIVTYGKEFEEMARRYSDDTSAQRGGLLPMMPLGDLVSNYSAAASALEPGQVSEVVRTEFGYHVIRLNDRVGDNIETNHILIRIDEESVDADYATNKLEALRDSVLHHGKNFRDLARKYSDDPESSGFGGRILDPNTGQRLLQINRLDPALYRIVLLLDEEGDISEPRAYTIPQNRKRAYRIVRLDRHIPEHVANLEDDYEQIESIALQEKQMKELDRRLKRIKRDVYVEYKIPIPDDIDETQLDDPALTPPVEAEIEE